MMLMQQKKGRNLFWVMSSQAGPRQKLFCFILFCFSYASNSQLLPNTSIQPQLSSKLRPIETQNSCSPPLGCLKSSIPGIRH